MTTRHLIVNADDFGQSHGINRGIVTAHERGIVTSTSLMVRWPAAAEAAALARVHPRLSVGLHVDLGEWAHRDGEWVAVYEVIPPDDATAGAEEVNRQLAAFRSLMGRDPTHLDSHQHVHRREPARTVLVELAAELGVPLRHFDAAVHYCGRFYGQDEDGSPLPGVLTVEGLLRILAELPAGLTELACHPGQADDLETMYRTERRAELDILRDPRVRQALDTLGIELRSFHGLCAKP